MQGYPSYFNGHLRFSFHGDLDIRISQPVAQILDAEGYYFQSDNFPRSIIIIHQKHCKEEMMITSPFYERILILNWNAVLYRLCIIAVMDKEKCTSKQEKKIS